MKTKPEFLKLLYEIMRQLLIEKLFQLSQSPGYVILSLPLLYHQTNVSVQYNYLFISLKNSYEYR